MTQTALVTGASSGIGLELAKMMARDGYNLVLVARSAQKLEDLAASLRPNVQVLVVCADLATAEGPSKVFAATEQANIEVDVLVNNAGYGNFGDYEDIAIEEELGQLQLNIVSLSLLTKLYAPGMINRKRGHILNVASTAAFQPGPLMSVYYATKAYVLSYSLALANEFRPKGVSVTCLCPGPTKTGFQHRASLEESKLMNMAYMDAKTVAEQGYGAMLKGKPLKINGKLNWILAQTTRLLPRTWLAAITRRLQERRSR